MRVFLCLCVNKYVQMIVSSPAESLYPNLCFHSLLSQQLTVIEPPQDKALICACDDISPHIGVLQLTAVVASSPKASSTASVRGAGSADRSSQRAQSQDGMDDESEGVEASKFARIRLYHMFQDRNDAVVLDSYTVFYVGLFPKRLNQGTKQAEEKVYMNWANIEAYMRGFKAHRYLFVK